MFSFFKSKPRIIDFIPPGSVDIHSHLLFGLDDGAKTPEDSIALAQKFLDSGYTHCVVTPHLMNSVWVNTAEEITARLQETQVLFKEKGMALKIKAAAEYMLDTGFLPLARDKKLLTVHDNKVLVEMSYLSAPMNLFDTLFELQVAGYVPILAHPERYGFYHGSKDEYLRLKNAGCLFQVNILSAMGYYGENVARTADMLLGNGLIDYAGSDLHHLNHADGLKKQVRIKNTKALEEAISNTASLRF